MTPGGKQCPDGNNQERSHVATSWAHRTYMRRPALYLGFALILLVCSVSSCGEGLVISMDENLPPTFKYKGNRWAECCTYLNFFVVNEVSADNIASKEKKNLWWIWPKESSNGEHDNLPGFTSGKVPDGWKQTVPEHGEPPPLVEGKTYEAGGNFHSGQDAHLRFTVRNGKAVRLQ
jgi:hypothetical protein